MQGKKKILMILMILTLGVFAFTGCAPTQMSINEPTTEGEMTESVATEAGSNTESTEADGNTQGVETESAELDPANPVHVTFYSYSLGFPTMKEGMEHLIQEFNDTIGKEKGVIVEGIVDENYTKNVTDIQAGNQVDLIQNVFPSLDVAKENLGIMAFEDVFPKDELDAHWDGISEAALSLGKIDGKTYGMAFTFSTPILFINGTLFEEAGLDPNNPPQTWDEVLAAAQQITEKTGKPGLAFSPSNGWVTYGLFYSNGAGIFNEDRSQVVFASPEGVEAIEKWKEFYTSGCAALGTDGEVVEQFMAGNAGMTLNTTAMLSGIRSSFDALGLELTGTTMPSFGEKEAIPVNSGSALVVRPDSDLKAKAIWEFVKYATGPRGYTIITSEIGYLPLRTEIADDPQYLKPFADEYPLVRVNLTQLDNVRGTIWPAAIATEGSQIFNNAIQVAVSTDADVGETLKKAQYDINALYK
ncbi:MAG: ABC transporter substrate-binding protein [Tissierellia bacterium]|nr:ABC transporter substrate-binding protein [Tissierellia bacterium]